MKNTINKLINLLTTTELKKMYLLVFLMVVMALLDIIGVASILPFMAVLTNPTLIETNSYLNKMFEIVVVKRLSNVLVSFCIWMAVQFAYCKAVIEYF